MKIETRRQRRIIAFNQLHFQAASAAALVCRAPIGLRRLNQSLSKRNVFLSYRKSAGSPLPNARVAYKMAAMRLHSRRINTL